MRMDQRKKIDLFFHTWTKGTKPKNINTTKLKQNQNQKMNTTLLNQTILCGQLRKGMCVILVLTEMNEEEKKVTATLIDCRHPEQSVNDRFEKNAVVTATSMNNLKDQIFQMLEIPNAKFRTTSWKDVMRINGKTIDKFLKQGPVIKIEPESLPVFKPVCEIYLIEGKDFGYIGQTLDGFDNMMRNHERACLDNRNGNFNTTNSVQQIYAAINNNGGWDSVNKTVLETFECESLKEALEKENEWILKIKSDRPKFYLLNTPPLAKCSEPGCDSKTRRMCSKPCCKSVVCKKHDTCAICKGIDLINNVQLPPAEQDKLERNRERARNVYRQKMGIPLDAPLIQRGGAHNVKYRTAEEKAKKREMDREYQREYQKKYRESKMSQEPLFMMQLFLEK